MNRKQPKKPGPFKARTIDEWEREWQRNLRKAGSGGYELPVRGATGAEREFLTYARTPVKEIARLKRILDEFVRGFKGLYRLGPAVTVFGSARFKEDHRYYKLARAVGTLFRRATTPRLLAVLLSV